MEGGNKMMKVFLSPQLNETRKFNHELGVDFLRSTLFDENGEILGVDEFDFQGFADGELDYIETTLAFTPIIKAYRINGVLHLELLNFIGTDATEEEKFPVWKEV